MNDPLEIITCEQGSPEWVRSRLGIPTASEFAAILTKGRGGAESKTRLSYLYKLAGERLTGEPMETVSSFHMERGQADGRRGPQRLRLRHGHDLRAHRLPTPRPGRRLA
jgi:hypothetical protein